MSRSLLPHWFSGFQSLLSSKAYAQVCSSHLGHGEHISSIVLASALTMPGARCTMSMGGAYAAFDAPQVPPSPPTMQQASSTLSCAFLLFPQCLPPSLAH
jgi:hypothetical protein